MFFVCQYVICTCIRPMLEQTGTFYAHVLKTDLYIRIVLISPDLGFSICVNSSTDGIFKLCLSPFATKHGPNFRVSCISTVYSARNFPHCIP